MFFGALAFNQSLPTFNTSEVTTVSVFFFWVQPDKKPDSDFCSYPTWLSDGVHVHEGKFFQSATTCNIRYFQGYKCEFVFVFLYEDQNHSDTQFYLIW